MTNIHRGSCIQSTSYRAGMVSSQSFSPAYALLGSFAILGAIAISAVVFNYAGTIDVRLGSYIHVHIAGVASHSK